MASSGCKSSITVDNTSIPSRSDPSAQHVCAGFLLCFSSDKCRISIRDISPLVSLASPFSNFVFFCNDTATTDIYTLSLHDALFFFFEEHASHLHSRSYLACRLPL